MFDFLKNAAWRLTWGPGRIPDLSGRVFIVTGGNSGLGLEVCRELALHGATVVMAGRNKDKCCSAISEIAKSRPSGTLRFMHVELASLKSVRAFADEFLGTQLPLHGLICNAGVGLPRESHTQDGFEATVGINFYSHFCLAHLLLGKLKASAPSRIVFMSSPEESRGFVPWDDMKGAKVEKSDFNWYGSANLWKLMAAKELAERLHGTGVEVFAVQPGMSRTDFFPKMDYSQTESTTHNKMQQLGGQPASRGAISTLFAATEPSLAGEGRSGAYFGPYYFRLPNWFSAHFPFTFNVGQTMELQPANSLARDPDARRRLYEAAADTVEEELHSPLPGRLPPPPPGGVAADTATAVAGAREGQAAVL